MEYQNLGFYSYAKDGYSKDISNKNYKNYWNYALFLEWTYTIVSESEFVTIRVENGDNVPKDYRVK